MRIHLNRWMVMTTLAMLHGASGQAVGGPPKPATVDEIRALIEKAGSAEDHDGADVLHVLEEDDVYVHDSGLATTESCRVVKLLTDKAVKSQSVQRFDFDPATRRVDVRTARIHRKDGTTEDVSLSSIVTQPTPQSMIYWGGLQHLLTLPGLCVGDTIELRVSKIGFNIAYLQASASQGGGMKSADELQPPMPGHWYEVTLFAAHHPIMRKRYSVHMPPDKAVQYEVYNGSLRSSLWFADDRHVYTWTAEDLPAIKKESHMVALDDCVTKLVMATVPNWKMKSRWFFNVNEGQFDADDAIREKVAEITADLTTDDEKIAACNHWVADNIRYCGTSRGPCEGFTLHTGIETFRDRAGVCKDKAGMLVTMLRALGIEAYAALTMAGSRVEPIPADQFNHTVTVVRNADGDFRILDPTWIPLSREMWSSREALQGLVYGTPEGQPLTLSPYYPPDYNLLACRGTSTIAESGQLHTQIIMDMKGYPCTYLRRNVARHRPSEVRAAFESQLRFAPNARLQELDYTDPYDFDRDSQVRITATADRYAARNGGLCAFRLPLMSHPLRDWLVPDLFYSMDAESREYGLRMRATRGLRYTESVRLPDNWAVEHLPDDVDIDSPSARLAFHASRRSGGIEYAFELDLKKQIVPPDDYVALRNAIKSMKDLADRWTVCRIEDNGAPTGGHAAGG